MRGSDPEEVIFGVARCGQVYVVVQFSSMSGGRTTMRSFIAVLVKGLIPSVHVIHPLEVLRLVWGSLFSGVLRPLLVCVLCSGTGLVRGILGGGGLVG
eukprot:gene5188-biopygen13019